MSEVFSSSHKRVENKFNASPAAHRSPIKAIPPPTLVPSPAKAQNPAENASHPEYPDLNQNLNSFPKYNTDSGYHGMHDDDDEEEEEEEDDMVLTQVQPESQTSTQPLEKEPTPADTGEHPSSPARRTTAGSFHSAQENVRQRGETVEPVQPEPSPKKASDEPAPESPPKHQETEPTETSSPVQQKKTEPIKEPEPAPEPTPEPETAHEEEQQEVDEEPNKDEQEPEPELELKPEDQTAPTPAKSSPVEAPAEPRSEPQQAQNEENRENEENDADKDEMALDDNLDDIGSPSDGSTPERPPIRKSSLSFASLPAREPLMKRSLGGRISRTSHIDTSKLSGIGASNYLGRQTGGHRITQTAADDNASLNDKMEVDENKEAARDDDQDSDTRASKLHTKSSTQRLHEKISMLGKLQPSRPTKSIPSAPSLAPTQVSYPELPSNKPESKPEENSRRSHEETPAPEPMAVDEDWIKPFNSPYKANMPKPQTKDLGEKKPSPFGETEHSSKEDHVSLSRVDSTNAGEKSRASAKQASEEAREKSSTPVYASPHRSFHKRNGSFSYNDSHRSTTPVGSPARPTSRQQDGPISASKFRLQSIVRSAKGLFSNAGGVSAAAKAEASSPSEPPSVVPQPRERADTDAASEKQQRPAPPSSPRPEGRRTRSSTEQKRKQKELEDRKREEEEEEERAEKARQEKQEKQRAAQLKAAQEKAAQEKAAQEKAAAEQEARAAQTSASITAPTPQRIPQMQRHTSKEPETTSQPPKQGPGRPAKPNRDTLQKPKPQPVSIRVGSALSRQIPMASSVTESNLPAPTPASTSKQPGLKKKASNTSLHTASSNSSFKSTASTQSQRKAQLASERKKEQEEREARRREEQRRELERRRAAQQQEEARRQEMRSRAENERRERLAAEDPKKAAQMQAIEKRRLENARRLERQGSQQPNDTVSYIYLTIDAHVLMEHLSGTVDATVLAAWPACVQAWIHPAFWSFDKPSSA